MESSIPLLNLRNLGNLWTKPAEPEPSVDKIFSEQKKTKATKYKALEGPAVTAERRTKKLQRFHIHHASTCTPRHQPRASHTTKAAPDARKYDKILVISAATLHKYRISAHIQGDDTFV